MSKMWASVTVGSPERDCTGHWKKIASPGIGETLKPTISSKLKIKTDLTPHIDLSLGVSFGPYI